MLYTVLFWSLLSFLFGCFCGILIVALLLGSQLKDGSIYLSFRSSGIAYGYENWDILKRKIYSRFDNQFHVVDNK